MATPKTTRWPIEPHTQAKHLILRRYLEAWLPIMARLDGRFSFIDGFSGPGRYEGGEVGSPLIAIDTLLKHPHFATPPQKTTVNFAFIEENKDRHAALRAELDGIPVPTWVRVHALCDKFVPVMTALLDDIDTKRQTLAPTFAFIDPFGFSGVPLDLVRRILSNPRCECLITFMFESVNRFLGHPDPPIQAHFDQLFGTTTWRNLLELPGNERRDAIVDLYRTQLTDVAGAKFVRAFQMINDGNRTEYFLYFATHSPTGLSKMKQAMWKADPAGGQQFSDRTDPHQMVLVEPTADLDLLQELLRNRFRGAGLISISDVENFVLVDTPFSEAMHLKRKTLKPMEKAGQISVVRPGSRNVPGEYPTGSRIQFL